MAFFTPAINCAIASKVLVIPVVSSANVSQLAVDLLIASLSLRKIGVLDPSDVVPVIGAREEGEMGVTTPLELYGDDSVSVVVLQQRSPALKLRKQEFVDSLLQFAKDSGFSAVLFLSGVDLSNRSDSQMMTPTYHIIPSTSPSLLSSPLSHLTQLPIPAYTSPAPQHPGLSIQDEGSIPFIPGGGLTRRFLSSIPAEWDIPVAALLQFVIEGDNQADANLMAAVVAKVLGLDIKEWKQPSSWRQGLFGTPHDQTLYG
ncbi:hypothetical protein JAAARDRAFT_35326 [Jaapia argillacea MUCL 33604]|uniref:Proteasome assembly chaperone 2 n=1 Tax=Jaapia argillacea MUCL 33604 TaxID=933084 RepID=A0A067PSB7_9AGAM|nr:hypothetical protein JAAARDRAFT_35326 [Jaapia argillacea MUCL 33604]